MTKLTNESVVTLHSLPPVACPSPQQARALPTPCNQPSRQRMSSKDRVVEGQAGGSVGGPGGDGDLGAAEVAGEPGDGFNISFFTTLYANY